MVAIVPPTLMNLAGLAGTASEPHVREGNHLRVAHHPVFGLPVAPFIIQRATLDRLPDNFAMRRDIVFRNAANQILQLPITVNKGDKIRATIVQGLAANCIMVGMQTGKLPQQVEPRRDPVRPFVINRSPIGMPITRIPLDLASRRIDTGRLHEWLRANDRAAAPIDSGGDLRMRGFSASMGQGPALVGERRATPYVLAAPGIAEVEITGRGVIEDMVWLAASDVDAFRWQTIDVLALPHKEGRRYLSLTDPIGRAEGKLRTQAPKRRPLQETGGAIAPVAAAAFTDAEESSRVHALAAPLDRDLDVLIDGPTPPLQAVESIPVTDAAGNSLDATGGESAISVSHLGRVLQATLDPGVAAWLGYKGLDEKAPPHTVCFYRVFGFFRAPASLGATPENLYGLPLGTVPATDRDLGADEVFRTWMKLAGGYIRTENQDLAGGLEQASDYLVMGAVAAIDGRAPPEPPTPPELLAPEHVAWLPAVPPAAVREVDCPLKGLLVGATLAGEREQPIPGGYAALNRIVPTGVWHSLLSVGLSSGNNGALLSQQDGRQGTIADRNAGADAARYHFAQQDRFGRWSDFGARDAAPGPRPKPPRPVVQGSYAAPTAAAAALAGGVFNLVVPLPEADSLAPGSFPLSHVRLSFRHVDATDPASASVPMPDISATISTAVITEASPPPGEAPHRAVPVTMTGPILAPTAQRRMIITGVWVDSAGQESAVSEELRLLMTDPRPPAQIPIADVLLYSSRPDATGLAWVERAWPVPANNTPDYAVYYTDEVRLIAWLNAQGRQSEAQAITATQDRAARAGILRAMQSDFPDHLFERIPGAVTAPSAIERRFRHALSGSSRILNAYKLAVEAPASGARPNLAGLDTVFYGVPNSDPPPRPSVSVRLVDPAPGEPELVAEVTVTLEAGIAAGVTARIYRTRGGQADTMSAPVVADVILSAPDPVTGRQMAVLRDLGAAQIAPTAILSAFSNYQWFATAQGAPESGSSVPGLWSRASDPVALATVPLAAPTAPTFGGFGGMPVSGGTQDLTLAISHPLGLKATPLGRWRYEVLQAQPGDAWSVWAAGEVREEPFVIADPESGAVTPLTTSFKVRLFDPVGRPAPAISLVTT